MGLRKNLNNMNQKIFIKTFGCQMNEYDSNRIFDSVKKIGYEKTEKYEEANCYLLNTCHIRDKAKEKVYHEIGRVKKIFRSKKKPLVIIAGCVAQAENQEMLKREPYIDLVIGPQSYHKINNSILNYVEKQKKINETEFDTDSKFNYLSKINKPVKTKSIASKYSIYFLIFVLLTNFLKPLPKRAHKLIVGKQITAAVIVTNEIPIKIFSSLGKKPDATVTAIDHAFGLIN